MTLFGTVVGMLVEVTGEDPAWGQGITAATRIEDELLLESAELLALAELLRERYGVDLTAHLASLDIDELIGLTVGDIVAHVAEASR